MAAVLLSNTMAQNQNSNVNNDVKPTIFHDFLGGDCPPLPNHAATGGPPSASASRAVGPISTTSDLSSDRQVGSRLEGMPFYGQKSNFPGSDIANRYAGNKRSNSDSVPDFPDNSHLMKMVRPMRPIVQAATDSNPSKWERAIPVNVGPVLQYPSSRTPYPYQQISNKFKDPMSRGTSVISQSAADEGSRTGIKGSGVLKSVNVNVGEPSSSNPIREGGSMSGGRQMTIFYGGQAHVFDDVHPNKAEAIMGMAGSIGGSWSTNYSQNSSIKPSPSIKMSENNILPIKDMRDRFNSTNGSASSDRMPLIHGGHSGVLMTDARRPSEAGQEKP